MKKKYCAQKKTLQALSEKHGVGYGNSIGTLDLPLGDLDTSDG